jgi:hypothetical protein
VGLVLMAGTSINHSPRFSPRRNNCA